MLFIIYYTKNFKNIFKAKEPEGAKELVVQEKNYFILTKSCKACLKQALCIRILE
jgi:hypothetical protein